MRDIMKEADDAIERARARFNSCEELNDMEFGAKMEGPQLVIAINRCSGGRQAFMLIRVALSTWSGKDYDALPAMKSTAEKVRGLLEREISERGSL